MAPLYFKRSPINCVHVYDFLGTKLSSNITTDNVIEQAVMKFYIKRNEEVSNSKLSLCYIKSNFFTTFCMNAYGCQ